MKYSQTVFNWRAVSLLAAVTLLAGCASSAGLKPQERLRDTPATTTAATIDWPQSRWWQRYGDDQLDRLVDLATAENPDIHLARARIEQAQALAGVAGAATAPQITADGEFQRDRFTEQQFIPPPFAGNWYWNNLAAFNLDWDLDLWGARHDSAQSALVRAQATQVDAREATLALQTAVVRTYIRLWADDSLRALAQHNLQREQTLLDIARSRHTAGLGSQLEVDEAATALPDSRAQLEALDNARLRLRHQLALLAGQPPAFGEALQAPALQPADTSALPTTLPADLLGHRPDVTAARLRVQAAGRDIAAAKARFYPDVNLSALAGFQALSFSSLLTGSAVTAAVGPAISLPIFDGGRLRSQLKGADAGYDAAVDRYNEAVLRALQQTADAIDTLQSLARQSTQVDDAVDTARRSYQQARQGYAAGLSNELNALHAQQSLLSQQRQQAQLAAQRLSAYAELMQTLGGGYRDQVGVIATAEEQQP